MSAAIFFFATFVDVCQHLEKLCLVVVICWFVVMCCEVGEVWNHGTLWLSIQLGIWQSQPQLTQIFQRGGSTTSLGHKVQHRFWICPWRWPAARLWTIWRQLFCDCTVQELEDWLMTIGSYILPNIIIWDDGYSCFIYIYIQYVYASVPNIFIRAGL